MLLQVLPFTVEEHTPRQASSLSWPPKWVRQHLHPRPSDSQAQPFAYGTLLPTSDIHESSSSSQGTFACEIIKSLSAARDTAPDWLGEVSFPLEHTELLARSSVSRCW